MSSYASQSLTFSGNAVAAETVTVGLKVYTWRAVVGTTANEVFIGATVAASCQNLADAINANPATAGVGYGSDTVANSEARAVAGATVVLVQSLIAGIVGNRIPTTDTMTLAGWASPTMQGGGGSVNLDLQDIIREYQLNASAEQALRELAFNPLTV